MGTAIRPVSDRSFFRASVTHASVSTDTGCRDYAKILHSPLFQDPSIFTLPSLSQPHTLYVALGIAVVVLVVAQRIPIVRTLVNIGMTLVLVGLLFVAVDQRRQFDPYVGKIARFLKIEDQQVVGGEVRIRMSPDGHFWARATIDGVSRRLLIDSGATITAISEQTADAAGIDARVGVMPIVLQTANGPIAAKTGTIASLRLGAIVARDLQVVVSPAFGETNVLGMNFLSRLASWRVEENTLILVPHHPQKVDG
ncbi:retropepsin-like aspartic protease family protein [Sphingomonas faeni]|uniref:retropepsin-like aspartic protease family protein n=1 Tax=Sphingomonas faeni TaxID=185950 RepID=UPI0033453921